MGASSRIGSQQPQQYSNIIAKLGESEKKDQKVTFLPIRLGNIFLNYVKTSEGLKATFKTVYHGTALWELFRPVSSGVQNLSKLTKDGKNIISATEVPGKTVDIGRKLAQVWKQKSLCSIKELVSSVSQITGPLADGVKLAADKNIVQLSSKTLAQVGFASNAGLAIGTSMAAGSEFKNIAGKYKDFQQATSRREVKEITRQVTQHAFSLGKFGSYAALGTVGVAGTLLSMTFASWIPLALSTSALAFTIVGHFNSSLHNDENKGDLASKKA
jgi:hypothetical protein